ncbi:PLP-dependent aminotransferase family protein [Oceanobacter mangrovi]|uniref:MocR-like pyridoxine biosynthesis transcription factor PdxR n=1 Tax=Oceanobacter mangrovi TaxID=2862510 RepID=UPI001C8D1F0B|nr:PLP-dependent aminotransferase family protein [Oceanobacter mangrovi]
MKSPTKTGSLASFASLLLSLTHRGESGQAGYLQLVEQIQQAILQGQLTGGQKLPSSRILAQQLGVSRSLINQAYDQLSGEGFLQSEPRRGIFVALNATELQPSARRSKPADSTAQYKTQNPAACQAARPDPDPEPDPLRLDSGADVSHFPAREWAASLRRSWLNPDPKMLLGEYPFGYPPLRVALCQYLHQVRQLSCQPEQVFVTAGNRDSLTLLQHALHSAEGIEHWLVENPTYPPIRSVLADRLAGYLELDEEGCCLPELPRPQAKPEKLAAVVTPNRQYPTGVSWSSRRRQQWLQFASASNSWIIEDDYDNEFVYHSRPGIPLMQTASSRPSEQQRVIFLGSLSKVMFRGLRLGFMVVPPALIKTVQNSQRELGLAASLPMQPALADFIDNGQLARHLNRMRRLYRQRRDQALQACEALLADWFEWTIPPGGLHLLLRLKVDQGKLAEPETWLNERLVQPLAAEGLRLSLLSRHYAQPLSPQSGQSKQPPAGLVIGFSAHSENVTRYWLERIRFYLQSN